MRTEATGNSQIEVHASATVLRDRAEITVNVFCIAAGCPSLVLLYLNGPGKATVRHERDVKTLSPGDGVVVNNCMCTHPEFFEVRVDRKGVYAFAAIVGKIEGDVIKSYDQANILLVFN
ncbi:MAG: hypothetical protein JZD41_02415 [Thermoproteus sp.]|nr:hypothetical protein [Thermoproteus sp.]